MKPARVITAVVLALVSVAAGYFAGRGVGGEQATEASAPADPANLSSAAAAPARAESATNPKIASVGDSVILKSDVEQLYAAIKQRAGPQAPALDQVFWMLTDQIIASRLVVSAALAQGLDKSELVQNSLKMANEQILQEAFINDVVKDLDKDALLKPKYEQMSATMKGQEEIRGRHILVEEEAVARRLIAELEKGADFAKLAKENSQDPGSKDRGGDLGYFTADQMVPEFAAVAFGLSKGEISKEPVRSQFGWHIIKVEDRRPRAVPAYDEVKAQLLSELQQESVRKAVEALREKTAIERFTPAGVPALPKLDIQQQLEQAAGQAAGQTTGQATGE